MNENHDNEKNSGHDSALPLGADNEALIQRKKASRSSPPARPVTSPQRSAQASPRTVPAGRTVPAEKTVRDESRSTDNRTSLQNTSGQNRARPGLSPASQKRPLAADTDAESAHTTVGKLPENSGKQYGVQADLTGRRHTVPARAPAVSQNAFSLKDTEISDENEDAVPIKVRRSAHTKASPAENVEVASNARRTQATKPTRDTLSVRQASGSRIEPSDKKKKSAASGQSLKNTPATPGISVKGGADMMSSIIKAIIYMVLVVVVSVFISIFVIRIGNDVFAFVKSDATVDVTIPEGATAEDIAQILYGDGIIKYPSVFKIYADMKHDDGQFIAGSYTVSPSMSYDELRNEFKEHIATGTSWITIPEGYSVDEIIDLMVENGIGERDKYIDVINNYDFDFWFIDDLEANKKDGRAYRLEGYLFPDTYEFYNASSEEMVINKMLKRFDEVFVKDYKTKAAELGYTVDDILTIASLIEKEAGGAADYMYVSSVFHNRLRNSWNYPRLESDATVIYAMQINTGVRPTSVTPDDLAISSPYNTYQNAGLPPGPITNPSASAIRYALYPAATDYYFFVTANNGKAFYATTKVEHDQNIVKVSKINES